MRHHAPRRTRPPRRARTETALSTVAALMLQMRWQRLHGSLEMAAVRLWRLRRLWRLWRLVRLLLRLLLWLLVLDSGHGDAVRVLLRLPEQPWL